MITIITGAPGTGKSAALVALLAEIAKGRTIYVSGIPDLKIEHEELEDPSKWPEVVPDGSVVVIDEVQRVWRPRGPGQKVPPDIAALETHRHRGLDFFIVTQAPRLIDSNVRGLAGRHVHLRDLGILGRWWYEWPECNDQCQTAWRGAPIKKRYRLPKAIFGQYKSASLHVKPIRSFPWVVVICLGALLATGILAWKAYGAISARMAPPKPVQTQPDKTPTLPGSLPFQTAPARPIEAKLVDERVDFIPRLSDRPWTAPAFDEHRQVQRVPYIDAALCVNNACKCYSSGQRIDVESDACLAWAERRPFNPYASAQAPEGGDGSSGRTAPKERQNAQPLLASAGG